MRWSVLAPTMGTIVAGLVLVATAGAEDPARQQAERRQAQQRGMVLQQRIIINPDEGDEQLIINPRQLLDVELQGILDRELIMPDDLEGMIFIRQGNQIGGQDRAVWVNDGRFVQRGVGLTQFNRLDQIPRDELTADRVLDLLGWSGMTATDSDEPLDIADWRNDKILAGLDDPDAGMRRRVTRAFALSERFDDIQMLTMLQSKELTLEQRSRLLDVSFARFVAAPRAAVGASFDTGVPIKISSLFQRFPAAAQNILQVNDELIEIDGQSLLHQNAFNIVRASVLSLQAGETITMVIRRPFAPDEVARIQREREAEREAQVAQAKAEAEARMAEANAQAKNLTNEANAPWEDDPVWKNIMRQMEVLQAKNPDATMELTPEGNFIFAGQRLGNIAHLDGVFARGGRAADAELREPEPVDIEQIITPGRTLTVEVPLGSLAELQRNGGGGAGSPGLADLHNAWKHRLDSLGIDLSRVTADTVSVQTPELGWVQANVGQRVTTLISSPRSSRQHAENSSAMNLAQRGAGGRGGWNMANPMIAEHNQTPNPAGATTQDGTAFRVLSTELAESQVQLRRHTALNEAAGELASLRDRRSALARRLQTQPVGAASASLQREVESLDRRIELIESTLRVNRHR